MRIVHHYHWALRGDFGTSIAVRGWCQAVAAAGEDVALLTAVHGAVATPPAGVELLPLAAAPADLAMPGSLGRAFDGADVVVLHGGWDVRTPRPPPRHDGKVPYLVTPHGAYYPQVFDRRKILLKRAWWSATNGGTSALARGGICSSKRRRRTSSRGRSRSTGDRSQRVVAPDGARGGRTKSRTCCGSGATTLSTGLDLPIEALSLVPSPERIPVRLHGVDWHGKRSAVSALVRDRGLDGSVAVEGPIYGDEKWGLMAGARIPLSLAMGRLSDRGRRGRVDRRADARHVVPGGVVPRVPGRRDPSGARTGCARARPPGVARARIVRGRCPSCRGDP